MRVIFVGNISLNLAMYELTRSYMEMLNHLSVYSKAVISISVNLETWRYVASIFPISEYLRTLHIHHSLEEKTWLTRLLQSHQNKFHADSIRELTSKFASLKPGDYVEPADQALWDYFADLYKNSNKGIKGRGKDRTVSNSNSNRNRTAIHEMEISRGSFALAAFGQGNMVSHGGLKTEGQYDMFDNIDGDSQSGQSTSSSDRTMYDDEYDSGRGSDAFGDRHGY